MIIARDATLLLLRCRHYFIEREAPLMPRLLMPSMMIRDREENITSGCYSRLCVIVQAASVTVAVNTSNNCHVRFFIVMSYVARQ